MRTVVAWLVATVCLLALLAPAAAAPPEDVAAYCRATYPEVQFQVRCLNVEYAAAARVSRASAGADPGVFNQCLSATASWASMEACLAQAARGMAAGGTGGVTAGTPTASPGPLRPNREGAVPAADPLGGTASAPPLPASPAAAGVPSPSTLGPQPGIPLAAPVERPSPPIPEADADRHLRAILERTGTLATQCEKKQYGPGWVTICEDARAADRGRQDRGPGARPNSSPPIDDQLGL
jgi:hypothetical protein